ncbi:MAG: caspase family protein [Rhodocyclaceae bacterium]|nr:caspase family protein [Rhodocyclaceae bacterium]
MKTVAFVLELLLIALAGLIPASAAEPPTTPILRVETGNHTSTIRRIVVDHTHGRVITAGDDKTVRIWQMPEQQLVRTLRVPIDVAHEGQLFALAVSPDGREVAVGGWTGWDWDRKGSVYVFDADSGELARRLGGFEDAIHALAWSPDGERIAVGLQGRAGLVVVKAGDGSPVAHDPQYRDKLTDLDFAPSGRLVAAGLDGMVRLYNTESRLIGRRMVPGGKQPVVVRFAPDGEHIAVGFYDAGHVTVVSARDLEPDATLSPGPVSGLLRALAVGWAADGQALYAAGDAGQSPDNWVFRWTRGERDSRQAIRAARQRISEIQPLADGQVVFSAEDPGFGVIDRSGRIAAFRAPDILDYARLHGHLEVSRDGTTVRYPMADAQPAVFSVTSGPAQDPPASRANVALAGPRLDSPGVALTGWRDQPRPVLNGTPLTLDDYEVVRSYAITPDGAHLVLGTEWALRMLTPDGQSLWTRKLAAVVRAVTVSGDGQVIVAALSDGTLRWFRAADGAPILAYFPHRNQRDWIAWEPRGHYMSSYFGDNYVGWHANRGRDTTPDFYRAVQFDRLLYRPDLVMAAFEAGRRGDRGATVDGGVRLFDISRLPEIAPPRLRVIAGEVRRQGRQASVDLVLRGEMGGARTQDFAVYVNGIPVTPGNERTLEGGEGERFTRRVIVPLNGTGNVIRVEAFNGLSMGVDETYVALPGGTPPERPTGDLYLLAIGVNEFTHLPADTHLAFAAQDAEAMAEALRQQGERVYRKVHVRLINDSARTKPDREAIEASLDWVKQARGTDTVVIFLASHGISDTQGNYYFVPRDASAEDIDRLVTGGKIETLVPWTTFFNGLRMAAGRRLLIVDTCQASKIEGRFESHAFLKRSAASLFSLMLASKGGEYSQEHEATGHGLFTYSLLESMSQRADADKDGLLTQEELFASAATLVDRNHDRRAGPQTPQLVAPSPLGNTPLVGVNQPPI